MAAKDDSKKLLREFGFKIVEQIKKGKNPEIVFPLRNLSNIIYDEKSRTLKLGNKKGSVGVGLGKGADTALAIDKAVRSAKKHLITLRLTKTGSIPHVVETKYSSARVFIQPSPGRGIVAGSAIRSVLELAGIKDVTAKLFSPTKNKLNIARVAIKALSTLPRIK